MAIVRGWGIHDFMNAPHRNTMEDRNCVVHPFAGVQTAALFCVFDGHGGEGAAEFAKYYLPKSLERAMLDKSRRPIQEKIAECYLETDKEIGKMEISSNGTTVVTALVFVENSRRVMYTANVGDSRAVLMRGQNAVRVSRDHKAQDPVEIARIEAAGGDIVFGRVSGSLAVSRSLGDYYLDKNHVIGNPDIFRVEIEPTDDFVVIASDGLWDVMEDQEVCEWVRAQCSSRTVESNSLCGKLVEEAITRKSHDNITVMIVWF